MKQSQGHRTMAIKAEFSNKVHLLINQKKPIAISELMTLIKQYDAECSDLLHNYWRNRKQKRKINEARVARGWKPKKRTTLQQYQMQQKGEEKPKSSVVF